MSGLTFWNNWHKTYKIIYQVLLSLFFITIIFTFSSQIWGSDWVLSWEVIRTYKPLEAPIATVEMLLAAIPVPVEHYIVTEVFEGGDMQLYPSVYIGLSVCSFLFLSVFISIITTLPRFWYFFGMTLVAFALVALRLEQLMLFDSIENTGLFLAIFVYFSLSYYFQAIKNHTPLYKRIAWFLVASLLLMAIFGFFSKVNLPLVYIGSYGIVFPLVFTFLFILLVAHDILSGFVYIITNGSTTHSKNSLLHFVVISGIYLGWVLLTYLYHSNYINWNLIYLDAPLLLAISAVVGIWGFRNRSESILSFLPFAPSGAFLYLILGIISFVTIGSCYLLANSPLLEVIEDAIIFSHLGVGFMFFIYIIGNFAPLLGKNLNVFKVQYKPKNLPYFTASIGGIVLIGVLVARSQLLPYYQAFAGYNNNLGDLYLADGQQFVSEQYYKLAKSYDYRNQKSNYALASMARKEGDDALSLRYFDDALLKDSHEHAYINISNIYESKGRFFDALFTLKKGLEQFPKSAKIKNNLGVLFSQTAVVDSAVFYLEQINQDKAAKQSAEVNLLYLLAYHRLSTDFDSLQQNFPDLSYLPLKNNTLVNLNIQYLPAPDLVPDQIKTDRKNINAEAFAFWYEYGLNQSLNSESLLYPALETLANDSLNVRFQSELTFLKAVYLYYHHHVNDAFAALHALINNSTARIGYYHYILGVWALEQSAPQLSVTHFEKAYQKGYEKAVFPLALSLTSTGNYTEALPYWLIVQNSGSQEQQKIAAMLHALQARDLNEVNNHLSDSLLFLHIQLTDKHDIPTLLAMAEDLPDNSLRWKSWIFIIDKALKSNYTVGMAGLFEVLEKKPLDAHQKNQLTKQQLRYWLNTNQHEKAAALLKDSTSIESLYQTPELLYAQAHASYLQNNREAAQKQFSQLALLNPFFEEGIIAAAAFFQNEVKDEQQAYHFLLNALKTNPYSTGLQKAYILQCLDMQLMTYAENSLATLKETAFPDEYEAFLPIYKEKKDSIEQVYVQWQ